MSDQPDIINQSPPRPEGGTSIPGINTIGSSGDPNVPNVDATLRAEENALGIPNSTVQNSEPAVPGSIQTNLTETPSKQATQATQPTQVIDLSDVGRAGVTERKIIDQLQASPKN